MKWLCSQCCIYCRARSVFQRRASMLTSWLFWSASHCTVTHRCSWLTSYTICRQPTSCLWCQQQWIHQSTGLLPLLDCGQRLLIVDLLWPCLFFVWINTASDIAVLHKTVSIDVHYLFAFWKNGEMLRRAGIMCVYREGRNILCIEYVNCSILPWLIQ